MKKIIKLLLLLMIMIMIFCFSSQSGDSSSQTSGRVALFIYNLYKTIINGKLDFVSFDDKYINLIRKMAHFSEFAMLGFMAYLNVGEYRNKHIILYSLLFSFIYAMSDEIHQLFVPNRTCALFDVMIDTLGATVGILLIHFISKKCLKK